MRYLELMEHLHYGIILTEAGRIDFLIKTYGPKLEKKWEASGKAEPPNVVAEIEQEAGETIAEKLVSFLVSHDPTRNQKYAQWLVLRYLQDGMKLEDAERTTGYLEIFDRAKARLPKKDINAYKSAADLFTAVRPFIEQNVAVSSREEQNRQARRMHQEDHADIIYDDPEMKIVIPKTEAASCYFGRNTEWCTAATTSKNYFNYYSQLGPLFIILLKKQNRRYQWHFERKEFFDENDRPMRDPSFVEFIHAHPNLIRIIGEDRFIPVIESIGVQFFSERAIRRMNGAQLLRTINSKEGYLAVPEDIRNDPHFTKNLLKWMFEAFEWVPQSLYDDQMLAEIVRHAPRSFKMIPGRRKTAELAELAAKELNYHEIQSDIPKRLWTEKVTQEYWQSRAMSDRKLALIDVPENYRNYDVYVACVRNNPADVQQVPSSVLTPELVDDIVSRSTIDVVPYLPARLLNKKLLTLVFETGKKTYDEAKHHLFRTFFKVPLESIPREFLLELISYGDAEGKRIVTWDKLPESLRQDEGILTKFLKFHPKMLKKIEHRYLTNDILTTVIDYHNVKHLPDELLTDELIVPKIETDIVPDFLFSEIPNKKLTPTMLEAFVKRGSVPVGQIPQRLRSPENVLKRLERKFKSYTRDDELPKEFKHIPSSMWTSDFATKLIDVSNRFIREFPDHVLTEPVLYTWLTSHDRHRSLGIWSSTALGVDGAEEAKKIFNRFDRATWSPRTTEQAIHLGLIEADVKAIPDHLMTPQVAVSILGRNPERLKELPAELAHSEEVLANAVKRNWRLLNEIPPENITEEIAYQAMYSYATIATHPTYHGEDRKRNEIGDALAEIDRSKWSERVWHAAVGRIVDLKDVPAKFRKPSLVVDAIALNPKNILSLKDPAGYLNRVGTGQLSSNEFVKTKLQNLGLIFDKKGLKNARDLDAEPLEVGGSAAVHQAGRVNREVYVFNPRGRVIARMVTGGGNISLPSDRTVAMRNRKAIHEAANRYLGDFHASDLHSIYIYDYRGDSNKDFSLEEELPRQKVKGIEWSEVNHLTGRSYVAWKGNKRILRLITAESGGWGRRKNVTLDSVRIFNHQQARNNAEGILAYMRSRGIDGNHHGLSDLGIVKVGSNTRYVLAKKQLAKFGDVSVFISEDAKRIGIFGKRGLMAQAVVRANGSIGKTEIGWDYRGTDISETIDEILKKIEALLIEKRKGRR